MDKLAHSCNAIPPSNWNEVTTDKCNNVVKSQIHCAMWEKLNSKDYKYYNSFYMLFWKKHNYRDMKQINGWQEKALGVTFATKGHQEILRGNGTVLCSVCGGS